MALSRFQYKSNEGVYNCQFYEALPNRQAFCQGCSQGVTWYIAVMPPKMFGFCVILLTEANFDKLLVFL